MVNFYRAQELEYEISMTNHSITLQDEVLSWTFDPAKRAYHETRRANLVAQRARLNAELTRVMLAGR